MTSFHFRKNYPLGRRTRFGVGGHADHFFRATDEATLLAAVRWCVRNERPWHVIGSGTNLLIADNGVRGCVIENAVRGIERKGNQLVVAAGTSLNTLVDHANRLGFTGIESMAGIPGTVGGAIVGNAGAYGQEIRDVVERVRIFDGREVLTHTNAQCRFRYRDSILKKRPWVVLSVALRFQAGNTRILRTRSAEIHSMRSKKFPVSLRCPGSYFQNVVLATLPASARKRLVRDFPDKVKGGKLPSAALLDVAGMRGKVRGGICIAPYHANLFLNSGSGTAAEVVALAREAQRRVAGRFGVQLEEEVRFLA